MPLSNEIIKNVLDYTDKHIEDDDFLKNIFDFIEDVSLKERIELEYYAARHIYKLSEALSLSGNKLYPHSKFQIMQFASIYEAIICHLLWGKYRDSQYVKKITSGSEYKKVCDLSKGTHFVGFESDVATICVKKIKEKTMINVSFKDKVDAFVKIGLIEKKLGDEIQEIYTARNGIHIEKSISDQISYEIDLAKKAYRRMLPFTKSIKGFMADGKIPENAKLRSTT